MEENKIFFGKYRVSLDAGGMPIEVRRGAAGVTCQAEEISSGKVVALELLSAASLNAEMREQIEAEGLAAKQLNHLNIPVLYDFGFDEDDLVYVTEYFDGTTAEAWVTAHGPMPVRAVLRIALQVVSALGAAAFHLVFHRSIHPGNILVVPGQTAEGDWPLIKVLNFGRVLPSFRGSRESNVIDKSAPFASPEQLEQGTVDFRSEIYSLGCTLWSLLTGVSPFSAPGKAVADAQMAMAKQRFRGVPKKIGRLIAEMVSINPDERPLDPIVMTQHLQDCLGYVERREAIARRIGIPASWQRRRVVRPRQRSITGKLAIAAAVLLALATVATLVMPERFRPIQLWQAMTQREPIGVPIGIPETAAVAQDGNVMKPDEPTSLEASSINDTSTSADALAAATASPPSSSASEIAEPSPSVIPSPQVVSEVAKPEQSAAPNVAAVENSETVPEQPAMDATERGEPPPPNEKPEVFAAPTAELIQPPPSEGAGDVAAQGLAGGTPATTPVAANKVPRAELVEEPSATESESASEPSDSISANKDQQKPATTSAASRPRRKTGKVAKTSASRRHAGKRIRVGRGRSARDGAMVRVPGGMVHARFIGTTADGRWLLATPSHGVMVVPPPPDFDRGNEGY
jgi:serine/threonine-protein kinase